MGIVTNGYLCQIPIFCLREYKGGAIQKGIDTLILCLENLSNREDAFSIEEGGERKSLTIWAKEFGLNRKTLSNRINKLGWDKKRALETPARVKKRFSIEEGGEKKSMADWARDFGLSKSTLWDRIYTLGWPIKKAITLPARAKIKKRGGSCNILE